MPASIIQAHYQGDFSLGETHYRKALDIYRKIGYRRGEGEALAHLCLLNHQRDDNHSARRYGEQAVEIARELNDPSDLGYGLTFLGHALAGLEYLAEAEAAYREALGLRLELGEHNRALEPRAGLAQVALLHGDLEQARIQAEAILAYIETGGDLSLMDEPGRVFLAAYQVLEALDDKRARQVLEDARRMLRSRAEKIENPDLQRVYLEQIPIHKLIFSVGENK